MCCVEHRRNFSADLEQNVDPNFQDMILPTCLYLTYHFSKSNLGWANRVFKAQVYIRN